MERVRVAVRVVPRAGRVAVGGSREGALLIRVTAAAVDGAANVAAAKALAKALGIAPGDVRIERGARSRSKDLSLPAAAAARLAALMR